jgi:arginyl-tRNA synthetase
MSNAIGESLSRLHEAAGATVIRANYQGDIGLHVAMSVWAMHRGGLTMPAEDAPIAEKTAYLGRAYAAGSKAYRSETEPNPAKAEIETVNKALYEHSDPELSALYHKGRAWSLEYFEEIYARLGTKFARYFFESEVGGEGKELVMKHPEIFPESDGARVFHGEPYGLHTRVFVNSRGLPTYEAKELGLNKRKFELYPDLDRSIIVTGNEIADYFKVLLKAMELVVSQAAAKTRHVAHGMLRLPTGKMSSRTGDVVTADSLIEQTKEKIGQYQKERTDPDTDTLEQVAIGAIKYSILKQNPGQDIIFDFEKSLSVQGESGPYLQYTHARFSSVLRKASEEGIDFAVADAAELSSEAELACMRKIVQFDDAIALGVETLASSHVARYLFELANLANKFYELMPVMKEERTAVRLARLLLVSRITETLAQGLHILGIQAPARM